MSAEIIRIFTVIAFVICIASFIPVLHGKSDKSGSRFSVFLLCLVLFVALALRIYGFGLIPGGMNQDGAMAAVDAAALASYGTDRLGMRLPVMFTAWGYGQMSVLMSYLMIPFIKAIGLNAVSARLPVLIISLIALVALYLACHSFAGREAALCVLALAAVCPWHIMQSRWALDCNLLPHFFIFGFALLIAAVRKEGHSDSRMLVLSMLMFALCMYCYGTALYTVPVFLLSACIYLAVCHKVDVRQVFLCIFIYLLFSWPFFATMTINWLKLDSLVTPAFTIPRFPASVRSADILFFSKNPPQQLIANLKSLYAVLVKQSDGLPWNCIKGFGTVYLFSWPFTLLGIYMCVKNVHKNLAYPLLFMFAGCAVFAALITNSVNINRANMLFYPLIIFTGLGIQSATARITACRVSVILMYLAAAVCFVNIYFISHNAQLSDYFLKDFGEAIVYTDSLDAGRISVTADTQYKGSKNVSEILLLFYSGTDSHFYQGLTEENGIYYSEKYSYGINGDDGKSDVFIIRDSESELFDPEAFYSTQFGRFYVLERK